MLIKQAVIFPGYAIFHAAASVDEYSTRKGNFEGKRTKIDPRVKERDGERPYVGDVYSQQELIASSSAERARGAAFTINLPSGFGSAEADSDCHSAVFH